MINLVTKQLTMNSIFSGLPNNIIIKIIQIENDRRKAQKLTMERKYNEVNQEFNKLSGRHCDLDEGYWYGRPWVRSRCTAVPSRYLLLII